jgi:CysZ protein
MSSGETDERRPTLGLGDGLRAFFGGIGFVIATPGVWAYAAAPVGMAVLLACGLSGLGFWSAGKLSTFLIAETHTLAVIWQWFVTLAVGVMLMAVAVLVALALAQPLSGWALEAISRRQERALTGQVGEEPGFFLALWLACRYTLFTAVAGGFLLGTLFLLGLIFPPAMVVIVPLKFVLVAWLVAWNLIDYPLGLRGLGVRQRLRWVWARMTPVTVFGLAWATVLLVPGIALLVLPMGVAGATRLVVAAEAVEEQEDELSERWACPESIAR